MDKRFEFIRSKNRFEGLPDYEKSSCLKLNNKSIHYPVQYSLFNDNRLGGGFGLRTKEGYFFELLCHGIYGGSVKSQCNGKGEDSSDIIITEPDITDFKNGIFREVKGVSSGEALKLMDKQIIKYCMLQSKEYFTKPTEIRFDIFRHGIQSIQNNYKNKGLEELIKALSDSIKFSISLPFSVIFRAYSEESKFTSRHDNEQTYYTLTRLNSSGLNNFLAYPEETLKDFHLNPEDFIIKKRRFPRTVTINGFKINSFPMLFIYDKNPEGTVNLVEEGINSNEILSERLFRFTSGLIGTSPENYEEPPEWMLPRGDVPF